MKTDATPYIGGFGTVIANAVDSPQWLAYAVPLATLGYILTKWGFMVYNQLKGKK